MYFSSLLEFAEYLLKNVPNIGIFIERGFPGFDLKIRIYP